MRRERAEHQQLYLLVYTETDADAGQYQCGGGLDLGLNEAGLEAARKLARRFKKNPLKIKRIFASPELRSIQMADVLHDEIKTKMTIAPDLADRFLGDWEGKPLQSTPTGEPPRGETTAAFELRVSAAFEKILSEPGPVVIVTHPRVARSIFRQIGLGAEKIERGTMIAIDLPAGEGIARFREI